MCISGATGIRVVSAPSPLFFVGPLGAPNCIGSRSIVGESIVDESICYESIVKRSYVRKLLTLSDKVDRRFTIDLL
jgi:hypothetical protein